jgi:hypothetical protein
MRHFPDNLGLATDLLLHTETGVVESRDDYIVVRTPDAPEYFFGNMLVLPQRPLGSDLKRLEHDFAHLIGTLPLIAHRTFAWSESADSVVTLDAFVEQGYDATVCWVKARPFAAQQDWDHWSRMQLADMRNPTDITSQRYMAHQQTAYRRLIDRGLGTGGELLSMTNRLEASVCSSLTASGVSSQLSPGHSIETEMFARPW